MNTNKKRSMLKGFAVPAVALVLASVLSPGIGLAAETGAAEEPDAVHTVEFTVPSLADANPLTLPNAPGALTSPPPASPSNNLMQSLAANQYLTVTYCDLSASGSNSVRITAITKTSTVSAQAGVTAYLQYWNGSAWINIGSPTTSVQSGSANVNYTTTVTKGYYYRVKSDHWATSGSSRESNVSYSNTVLVSN